MVSQNLLFDAGLVLYILFGSTSWGYILLRMGWPNIRSLKIEYKSGWSIIFGLIFTGIIAAISLIIGFLNLAGMALLEIMLGVSVLIFFIAMGLFTAKRKLLGGKKVNVAVPKRAVTANIAAKKAVQKLPLNSYIKVSSEGAKKIHELTTKTSQKETKTLPKKTTQAEVPLASKTFAQKTVVNEKPVIQSAVVHKEKKKETKSILRGITSGFFRKKIEIPSKPEEKPVILQETETIKTPLKKPLFGELLNKKKPSYEDRQKSADEIVSMLGKKQFDKEKKSFMTREEISLKIEKSEDYIKQNMREKLRPELENHESETPAKKENVKENLPKSAKLLKQLLQETDAEKKNDGDAQ